MKGKIVPIQLKYPEYSIDFEELKKKINDKTKLIIVNNPNNPTGKILSENDLKQFEQILKDSKFVIYLQMKFMSILHLMENRIKVLQN